MPVFIVHFKIKMWMNIGYSVMVDYSLVLFNLL